MLPITLNSKQTMSSLEIAKLTGKDHKNVLADIRKVLEEAEIRTADFSAFYLSEQNKELPCFNLPRRECDLVVSSYSVPYRLAIIDRWHELEKQSVNYIDPMKALSDPAVMRGLLLGYTEKVIELESKVVELQPKATALDRISDSEGLMNVTSAAKNLQLQPKKLFDWLKQNKWIYRRPGGSCWLAYQSKLQAGVLKHKITTIKLDDGSEKISEQVLVTAKGLVKLSEIAA